MMMSLGKFLFELRSVPYKTQQRTTEYRLAEHLGVGSKPQYQPIGQGEDQQTLGGTLYPEITSGAPSLQQLRDMQSQGEAYTLIDGNGYVHAKWYIKSIDETSSEFLRDGIARKIEFSITLVNSFKD